MYPVQSAGKQATHVKFWDAKQGKLRNDVSRGKMGLNRIQKLKK